MRRASFLAAFLTLFLASAAHAQDADLHFTEDSSKGWCWARVWGPVAPGTQQGMVLEFGYNALDGSVQATIHVSEWPRVRDADFDALVPMALVLDGAVSPRSPNGGYDSPYDDRVWGVWQPAPSRGIMASLKTAKFARVQFDGMDLGPFRLPAGGRMYRSLTECAARVRAAKE